MYYPTQWDLNEGCWNSTVKKVLWKGEIYFDVVGNFDPKKITPSCNTLAKSINSYLGDSYFPFVFLVSA